MKNLLLFAFCFLVSSAAFGQTLLTVDFETVDDGYTPSTTSGSGYTDVFNRDNTDLPSCTNEDGYFWAVEDISSNPSIDLDQINVVGYSDFTFSIDMVAHHYEDWDNTDELLITYSIDGNSYQNLMWVQSNGTAYNQAAALDTDFDGSGECGVNTTLPALTTGSSGCIVSSSQFATFLTSAIPFSGNSTLDIKLQFNGLTSENEGIYLDNIVIEGTTNNTPYVGFDATTSSETETNLSFGATIPVTFGNYNGSQVDLTVAVTGGTAEGTDYTLNTGSLTFTADGTQNISIDINPDADFDDETIEITITEATSTGIAIAPSVHTITVTDDDIVACTTPIWVIDEVTLNSESDTWAENSGDYSVNGYTGSTPDATDVWLVYGPLDMSGTSVLELKFDLIEGFDGGTDSELNFKYTDNYTGDAGTTTWTQITNLLGVGDDDEIGESVDYGAATGVNTYIAIQYIADGAGGASSEIDITNISLEADVCPSVPCVISSVSAVSACNGDNAEIIVSWTDVGTSGTVEVDINTEGDVIMTSGGTYTITGPTAAATGVTVTVRDASNNTCMATTTVDIMECPATLFCESFDDGSVPTVNGWTNTGVTNYSSGFNAAKSLKFDGTGDQLATPILVDATELSFYIKGNSTDPTSAFLIEAWDGAAFVVLENITNLPTTYTQKVYSSLPNYQGFRMTYTKNGGNLAFDDMCYTTASVTTTVLPLPVELLNFSAKSQNQTTILNWATASEENNAYFDVQRSTDGENFETIGRVEGAGTTYDVQEYLFIDESPINGLNYYRLQQVDFDGQFENHKIISVSIQSDMNDVVIVPNQVRNQFDIVFNEAIDANAKIDIYTINGQLVNSMNMNITGNRQTIDASKLHAGMYIIRMNVDNRLITKRFVKM